MARDGAGEAQPSQGGEGGRGSGGKHALHSPFQWLGRQTVTEDVCGGWVRGGPTPPLPITYSWLPGMA